MKAEHPQDQPPIADDITEILVRCRGSDLKDRQRAENELFKLVYPQLRQRAEQLMARERQGHVLQATALVNEAYLKILPKLKPYENRRHFFGSAFRAMWQVLINNARERNADKRWPSQLRVDLTNSEKASRESVVDVLELEDALQKLSAETGCDQPANVVRWHAMGFTYAEIAETLEIGETKAMQICRNACMRLRGMLKEKP